MDQAPCVFSSGDVAIRLTVHVNGVQCDAHSTIPRGTGQLGGTALRR
jgi:hypothetical protein